MALYFQKVYIYALDSDAGIEDQEKPLVKDLPSGAATARIALRVDALNFRFEPEIIETDYVGGRRYSTRKIRMVCDLLVSTAEDDYNYPTTQSNVEHFYSSWWIKSKYHWLAFSEGSASGTTYNLPPDMVTSEVDPNTQQCWACNLVMFDATPFPDNGSYTVVGKLVAIKES